MKSIRFYLLNVKAETYNTYQTLDQLIGFLSRLKYIRGWTIIVSNGTQCLQYENITDTLSELHKQLISAMNALIKA
jgi:hypothetical protein